MGCGNSRSTKIKQKEQESTNHKNSGKEKDKKDVIQATPKRHDKAADDSKIDEDQMYNLAKPDNIKKEKVDPIKVQEKQKEEKAKEIKPKIKESPEVKHESPKIENKKENSADNKNEMTPGQSSTPEIVKPVMKKEIPSVTPAMELMKKGDELISPFDDNIFPPNKKTKLPPLNDPRKLPPIENTQVASKKATLMKENLANKEITAPKNEKVLQQKQVIPQKKDPVQEIKPQEEVIGTDSSLRLSEGAMLEAHDFVSDMFTRTKQIMKPKKVPFKYQQIDGGNLKSMETKEMTNVKSISGNQPGSSFMTDKLKGFQIASETESDGNNIGRRASQYNNEVSKRMENTQEKFHKAEREEEKLMQDYNQIDQSQGGINPNRYGDSEDPEDVEEVQDNENQRLSTVMVSEGKMEVAKDYVEGLMENVRIMTKPANRRCTQKQTYTHSQVNTIEEKSEDRMENKQSNNTGDSIDTLQKYGDFKEKRDSEIEARKEIAHSYVSSLINF
ncbi:unnamed protein product [Moneuplotes crassus]|uniref:Uncharacterized protein n=1 Tax=Euplotes crassus TaxID=5936 RepID=A0AAD1Y9A6_EUPCR|nr:unnamed protein product [Moneuplotes crassus]